jgi:hypothetical protein
MLSQSFVSKSITVISLTGFILANVPILQDFMPHTSGRLRILFVGALLFVIGHLVALIKAPPEFQGRAEAIAIVADMLVINSPASYASRYEMFESLVARMMNEPPPDMDEKHIIHAQQTLAANPSNVQEIVALQHSAASVYHADIVLRDFDAFHARAFALAFLAAGSVLMLLPTMLNVLQVILRGICF